MSTFGDNLTNVRKFKGYTRQQTADFLGTKKYSYRNWEYGITEPPIEFLIRISQLFQISIDELVGNTGDRDNRYKQLDIIEDNKAESK